MRTEIDYSEFLELASSSSNKFIKENYKELINILDTHGANALREYLIKCIRT